MIFENPELKLKIEIPLIFLPKYMQSVAFERGWVQDFLSVSDTNNCIQASETTPEVMDKATSTNFHWFWLPA